MISYQKFKEEMGKIYTIVGDYQNSEFYLKAKEAEEYYARRNVEILKRTSALERRFLLGANQVKFHKLCNGLFPKFVKKLTQYLLSNGLSFEEKDKFGLKFDRTLTKITLNALVHGVGYGFWNGSKLIPFKATEMFTLLDENTGEVACAIRFFKVVDDGPLNIELYEVDGYTKYQYKDGTLDTTIKKRPYVQVKTVTILGETIEPGEMFNNLPVIALWGNELRESELSIGLKAYLDAYDFIQSDFVDSIIHVEGIYSLLKNYGGDDVMTLINEINLAKTAIQRAGGEDDAVKIESVETPHAAKTALLKILSDAIYDEFLMPGDSTGRAVTATEIKDKNQDLDIKADLLEWEVLNFVEKLCLLVGIDVTKSKIAPRFKRRTLMNDTETIQNIYTMRNDIDLETALVLNPLIPEEMVKVILARIEVEASALDLEGMDEDIEEKPLDDKEKKKKSGVDSGRVK